MNSRDPRIWVLSCDGICWQLHLWNGVTNRLISGGCYTFNHDEQRSYPYPWWQPVIGKQCAYQILRNYFHRSVTDEESATLATLWSEALYQKLLSPAGRSLEEVTCDELFAFILKEIVDDLVDLDGSALTEPHLVDN